MPTPRNNIRLRTKTVNGQRKLALARIGGFGLFNQPGSISTIPNSIGTTTSVSSLLGANIRLGMLEGIINEFSKQDMQAIYNDIYRHDHTSGAAVDLRANMPWSDFTLIGAEDSKLQPYYDVIDRLKLKNLHAEISVDNMVSGAFVSNIIYREEDENFSAIFPMNYGDCEILQSPLYTESPIIFYQVPEHIKAFMAIKGSKEVDRIKAMLPKTMVNAFMQGGTTELDPVATLYFPRTSRSFEQEGISYLHRIVPIWLMERLLYRGTLTEATKRQRSTLHITAGNEDWIPSETEMAELIGAFQSTEQDPISAVIATRESVQTNEVRSAGDFWKYTDIISETRDYKMQALGINDSFLCMTGDTLIRTDYGLIEIGSLSDYRKPNKPLNLDLSVASRYGKQKTAKWVYNGVRDTWKVNTDKTPSITATDNHPFLVLRPDLTQEWVELKDLQVGDTLLQSPDKLTRTEPLNLNLSDRIEFRASDTKASMVKKPKVMTPRIAWFIGMLLAEGSFSKTTAGSGKPAYSMRISNTNNAILDKLQDIAQSEFGRTMNEYRQLKKGDAYAIMGNVGVVNHDCWEVHIGSNQLGIWLEELGLKTRCHAKDKRIPWCILEADEESQLAFIAAYLDGDGCTTTGSRAATWESSSYGMLCDIYNLITSHGVRAEIVEKQNEVKVHTKDFDVYHKKLKKYLLEKTWKYGPRNNRYKYGIPIEGLLELFGDKFHSMPWYKYTDIRLFLYDRYDNGDYNSWLSELKRIDESAYDRLIDLVERRYNFTNITSIEYDGKQEVFDISMGETDDPSFTANGLVVHNSGDASYANMETALTVFVEDIRAYRDLFTERVYYSKLFPLVASINDLLEDESEPTKEEAAIKSVLGTAGRRTVLAKSEVGLLVDLHMQLDETEKLLIPEIRWHKPLRPEADREYVEMLQSMQELGIPIPIRMLASAGGVNFDQIVRDLPEDKKHREILDEFKPSDGEEDDYDFASVRGSKKGKLQKGKLSNLKNRPYKEEEMEVYGRTKTGKRRRIVDQNAAQRKQHEKFAKAVKNISSEEGYEKALRRRKKLGRRK